MADTDDTVRALVAGGLSYGEVCAHMMAAGIESPGGPGKPWHKSQVQRIVQRNGAPPRARPSPSDAPPPPTAGLSDDLPPLPDGATLEDRLRRRLEILDRTARAAEIAGSWTAVVQARTKAAALEIEIEALRPKETPAVEQLSDDDLRAELEALEGQALRVVGG